MNRFKSFLNRLSNFSLSLITLAVIKSPLAQQGQIQELYGPPVTPLYGVIAPAPFSIFLMVVRWAIWIVLPLAIIIGLIVGIVVYIKKKKQNAQKNTQNGPTQNLG